MTSVYDILTAIGYDLRDFGRSYRAKPLYRDSGNNTSLIVDKDTGKWHDFSTQQQGNLDDLIRLTLNLAKDADLSKYTAGYTPASIKPAVRLEQQQIFPKELLIKLRKDYSYWESRGVDKKTVEIFGGGVADNGKMAGRFVFPIYNSKDDIVGFAGRDIFNNSSLRPKWKLIGSKSQWCYPLKINRDIIIKEKKAIIVESIGDLLALWESGIKNVVVAFGVELSSDIISLLIKLDVSEIILAFNNDIDNNEVGNKAAGKAKRKLLNYFDDGQVRISLPIKKDFGEMSHEEIIQWKNNLK